MENTTARKTYSYLQTSSDIAESILSDPHLPFLPDVRTTRISISASDVKTHSPTSSTEASHRTVLLHTPPPNDLPILPINLKVGEVMAAMKAAEAAVSMAIAQSRFTGTSDGHKTGDTGDNVSAREMSAHRQTGTGYDEALVDVTHAGLFYTMASLSSVDGLYVADYAEVVKKLKDTDLTQVYANPYRRAATSIYETKEGRYYHLHASLDSDPVFSILGLPTHNENIQTAEEASSIIEARTKELTVDELEAGVRGRKIAGNVCLTREEFLNSEHGKTLHSQPLFTLEPLESSSPPLTFSQNGPHILSGVKILDLTRIIAGPTITRILSSYGAQVIRVTSPTLSDATYYQIDLNFGKKTVHLDLKSPKDRATFEKLIEDVDVIVDGYRHGALSRLGYGPDTLLKMVAEGREGKRGGKGFVYMQENCYGWGGEWEQWPGWQQIADSVSGVSWWNGKSMGKEEPVAPCFPFADFGTGQTGALAILTALHHRLTHGGSYLVRTSLTKFNDFLLDQGPLAPYVWHDIMAGKGSYEPHLGEGAKMNLVQHVDHLSNFAKVAGVAMRWMSGVNPWLFPPLKSASTDHETAVGEKERKGYADYTYEAKAHFGVVRTLRPVVKMRGKPEVWLTPTRWPGWDSRDGAQVKWE